MHPGGTWAEIATSNPQEAAASSPRALTGFSHPGLPGRLTPGAPCPSPTRWPRGRGRVQGLGGEVVGLRRPQQEARGAFPGPASSFRVFELWKIHSYTFLSLLFIPEMTADTVLIEREHGRVPLRPQVGSPCPDQRPLWSSQACLSPLLPRNGTFRRCGRSHPTPCWAPFFCGHFHVTSLSLCVCHNV